MGEPLAKLMFAGAAFACMAATSPPVQPAPIWSPTKRAEIRSMPIERAIESFRTLCVNTFPDADSFDRAAAASDLGFARVPATQRGRRAWTSRYGDLTFVEQRYWPGAPTLPHCSFDLAITGQHSSDTITQAIEQTLVRGRGARREMTLGTNWRLQRMGRNHMLVLTYLAPFDDRRLLTLQVKRVPNDWPL
jgi:hypothetical protein